MNGEYRLFPPILKLASIYWNMDPKPTLHECIVYAEKIERELELDTMEELERQREIEYGWCKGCGCAFINHPSFLDAGVYCLECI